MKKPKSGCRSRCIEDQRGVIMNRRVLFGQRRCFAGASPDFECADCRRAKEGGLRAWTARPNPKELVGHGGGDLLRSRRKFGRSSASRHHHRLRFRRRNSLEGRGRRRRRSTPPARCSLKLRTNCTRSPAMPVRLILQDSWRSCLLRKGSSSPRRRSRSDQRKAVRIRRAAGNPAWPARDISCPRPTALPP